MGIADYMPTDLVFALFAVKTGIRRDYVFLQTRGQKKGLQGGPGLETIRDDSVSPLCRPVSGKNIRIELWNHGYGQNFSRFRV